MTATILSTNADDETTVPLADPRPHRTAGHWSNYVAGVISGCSQISELRLDGFNALIMSTVPLGGGLSSSASLEVATATLIEAMTGVSLDPKVESTAMPKSRT